jgi:6-pyruvoyltetrahydropterin/6-carboxytetrahydropterin synthase
VYFNDFESDVKSVLDNFDHSYLNKMECFTGKVPSVENIAKTILKALARKLDNENLRISAVELWADPNRRVRYIAEVKNEK